MSSILENPALSEKETIKILKALQKDVYEISYSDLHEKTGLSKSFIFKKTKELLGSGVIQAVDPRLDLEKFGFHTLLFAFYDFDERHLGTTFTSMIQDDPHFAYWGRLIGDRVTNNYMVGVFRDGLEYIHRSIGRHRRGAPEYPALVRRKLYYLAPLDMMTKMADVSMTVINILKLNSEVRQSV